MVGSCVLPPPSPITNVRRGHGCKTLNVLTQNDTGVFHQPGPATVMRRGRLRLVPFTGQRTDKAQRCCLDPRPSVFTSIAPQPSSHTSPVLIWAGHSLTRYHLAPLSSFLPSVFISPPILHTPHPWGSTCNCSALMRTAKCHLALQLQPWVHWWGGWDNRRRHPSQGGRLLLSSQKSASSLGEKEF